MAASIRLWVDDTCPTLLCMDSSTKLTLLFILVSMCEEGPMITGVYISLNLASSDPVKFLDTKRVEGWRSIDLHGEI